MRSPVFATPTLNSYQHALRAEMANQDKETFISVAASIAVTLFHETIVSMNAPSSRPAAANSLKLRN